MASKYQVSGHTAWEDNKGGGTCCWSHRHFQAPPTCRLAPFLLLTTARSSGFHLCLLHFWVPSYPSLHPLLLWALAEQLRDGDSIRVLLGLSGLTMAHFWWLAATYTQPPTELLVNVLVLCNFKLFLAWILICKVQYMKKKRHLNPLTPNLSIVQWFQSLPRKLLISG